MSENLLTKVAVYGAVISVTGCTVIYYLIQSKTLIVIVDCNFNLFAEKIASSGYYTAAVEALKENEQARNLLGEPLRFQTLRLNDNHNTITTQQAQVNHMPKGLLIL